MCLQTFANKMADLKQDHGLISSSRNLQVTSNSSVVQYKGKVKIKCVHFYIALDKKVLQPLK